MDALNQAEKLIERAQNILILPSLPLQGDTLGSAMALFFTLRKLGKNVNMLTKEIPERFQFLIKLQPEPFKVPDSESKNFVISVDTAGKEVSKIYYEKNEKNLKIRLVLNEGEINKKDVSFLSSGQNLDLLIVLGAKSLEDLEELFNQNARLFYEAPILNIDNQVLNENFGEVNVVETTSSLAEISTDLIKLMDSGQGGLIDSKVASCLLTGIISASQNFQNPKTRPKTFEVSAFLIERGAEHQKIIQHLYRQKSLSQVKLLGKVLEKLTPDEKEELYSASLTKEDFQDCQSSPRDLSFVAEELRFNFRHLPNLLLLWESHASPVLIKGLFHSPKAGLAEKLLESFEGVSRGEGVLFLIRSGDLNSAKEKVLQALTLYGKNYRRN